MAATTRPSSTRPTSCDAIDNPYLPARPGHEVGVRGRRTTARPSASRSRCSTETREIEGITATVVRDTVYVDGELVEDTYDWFAQDEDGNVWYLGEDTHEYEDGEAVNADGRVGVRQGRRPPRHRDARPPEVGDAYRQEFYEGEAEDMAEVLEVGVTKAIGSGYLRRRRRDRGLDPARARRGRGEVVRARDRAHPTSTKTTGQARATSS